MDEIVEDPVVCLDYVSTGCSCSPHSCAWSANGLVAFASNRTVSLYSASSDSHKRVVATLRGHSARVNCVAWVEGSNTCSSDDSTRCELVSGSVDKQLIAWSLERGGGDVPRVTVARTQLLSRHSDVIVSVAACTDDDGVTWLASASADCSVCLWRRAAPGQPYEFVQAVACGRRGFVLDVSFGRLPGTGSPILACAADDAHIYLWALEQQGDAAEWRLMQQLTGHEDWVRTVAFAPLPSANGDLLLASGAQDSYVRVWRVSAVAPEPAVRDDDGNNGGCRPMPEIRLRENGFSVAGACFSATLDAVLSGHEHWVYAVRWQPSCDGDSPAPSSSPRQQPLCLLSASMDKTLMVWRFSEDARVWLDEARMGDVGGNTLGLYGAAFGPRGCRILAHGYQGAFHLWRCGDADGDGRDGEARRRSWRPQVTVSGHFGAVLDVAWAAGGACLLSVSKDQTCRLHCEWTRPPPTTTTMTSSLSDAATSSSSSWHEVARPQIHGYDLQCLAMTSPLQYACGADEKVIRVFDASALCRRSVASISGRRIGGDDVIELPLGATVPALGLSNKAVYTDKNASAAAAGKGDEDEEDGGLFGAADVNRLPAFSAQELRAPPYEEDLLQNTLWPETQKLYGHGYELYSMAADGRRYLASACKASKPEHAAIIIWDTAAAVESSSWCQRGSLVRHGLTITQLAFSGDGERLLAVSRDRTWSLWQRNDGEHDEAATGAPFHFIAGTEKASSVHQRVIWSCSWAQDDRLFATGSRDKKVALWSANKSLLQLESRSAQSLPPYQDCGHGWGVASTLLELDDAVTAVEFAPSISSAAATPSAPRYSLGVGLENGCVVLASWCMADQWSVTHRVANSLCPVQAVQRLRWRPRSSSEQTEGRRRHLQLAVASADHSVRVLAFPDRLFDS